MSIAVLSQVFTEARRLMIAGSVVARGDFRLKKLIPSLEQAPVFAKVAEVAKVVVDGPEDTAAASLLELTSLVNAVLYTQGETGLAGKLVPVETIELGATASQTSARVLKPLLEALRSTGSGRLELIKDAVEQGNFKDLRLVKPALGAIDDPYPEIAELITKKVLPLYGKAILPELREKYDVKGTKGHPRRLKLMHEIDPEGTRELVKAALDGGSKEVKVAAISCLGVGKEDLEYLVEQSSAKAQDLREAAYQALAKLNKPEAIAVLEKAVVGKDYHHVAQAIQQSKNAKMLPVLLAEIRSRVDGLVTLKDKKKVGESVQHALCMLRSFPEGDHAAADELILDLFHRRVGLEKVKGDTWSGADISEAVIEVMSTGSPAMQKELIAVHAELKANELSHAFDAGRLSLKPTQLFDLFSSYLTAKVDEKKKGKDPAWVKRDAIIETIQSRSRYYWWMDDDAGDDGDDDTIYHRLRKLPYDPRWLDLAVNLKLFQLVNSLAKSDHQGALAFLKSEFDAALKKAKDPDDVREQLYALSRVKHPALTEAFFATLEKRGKKKNYWWYGITQLIPRLSKDAIPKLDEFAATLPENEADYWLTAIEELRKK